VVRAVTLISLLGALLVGVYLFGAGSRAAGPTSPVATHAERAGTAAAAAANFQQASVALEQNRATTGTYAGTDLAGYAVTLVRADASSYCVQVGSGAAAMHLGGPGAAPATGPC
jgi:putative hemolysin